MNHQKVVTADGEPDDRVGSSVAVHGEPHREPQGYQGMYTAKGVLAFDEQFVTDIDKCAWSLATAFMT